MKKKLFILGFLVLGVSFQVLNALSRSERKKIVKEAQKIVKDVLGQKSFKSITDGSGRVTQHDISDSSNSASIQDKLNTELKGFLNKQKSTDAAQAAVDALKKALAQQIKKDKKAGVERPEVAQNIFETALGAQIYAESIDNPTVWIHRIEVTELGSVKSQARKIVKDALATVFNDGEKFHGTLHSIMLGGESEDTERRERVQEAIKVLLDQQTTLKDARGAVKALETALKKQMKLDDARGVVMAYSVEGVFESFIEKALEEKANNDESKEGIWKKALEFYQNEKRVRDLYRKAQEQEQQKKKEQERQKAAAQKVIDSLNFKDIKDGKFGADKALQAFLEKAETPQEAQERIEALKDLLTQEGRTDDLATLHKAVGQMLELRYRLEASQTRRDQEISDEDQHPEQGNRVLADGTTIKAQTATPKELEAWLNLAGTYDPGFKAKIEAEKQSSSATDGLFGGDGPVHHMTAAQAANAERKAHEQGDEAGKTGKTITTNDAKVNQGHVNTSKTHDDDGGYGFGDDHDGNGGTGSSGSVWDDPTGEFSYGGNPKDNWVTRSQEQERAAAHEEALRKKIGAQGGDGESGSYEDEGYDA